MRKPLIAKRCYETAQAVQAACKVQQLPTRQTPFMRFSYKCSVKSGVHKKGNDPLHEKIDVSSRTERAVPSLYFCQVCVVGIRFGQV